MTRSHMGELRTVGTRTEEYVLSVPRYTGASQVPGELLEAFFAPAHRVDRAIRTSMWAPRRIHR